MIKTITFFPMPTWPYSIFIPWTSKSWVAAPFGCGKVSPGCPQTFRSKPSETWLIGPVLEKALALSSVMWLDHQCIDRFPRTPWALRSIDMLQAPNNYWASSYLFFSIGNNVFFSNRSKVLIGFPTFSTENSLLLQNTSSIIFLRTNKLSYISTKRPPGLPISLFYLFSYLHTHNNSHR